MPNYGATTIAALALLVALEPAKAQSSREDGIEWSRPDYEERGAPAQDAERGAKDEGSPDRRPSRERVGKEQQIENCHVLRRWYGDDEYKEVRTCKVRRQSAGSSYDEPRYRPDEEGGDGRDWPDENHRGETRDRE
jgi:hypothetical protein